MKSIVKQNCSSSKFNTLKKSAYTNFLLLKNDIEKEYDEYEDLIWVDQDEIYTSRIWSALEARASKPDQNNKKSLGAPVYIIRKNESTVILIFLKLFGYIGELASKDARTARIKDPRNTLMGQEGCTIKYTTVSGRRYDKIH